VNFATQKAANPQDKSLQWKRLSAQLVVALNDWTKTPSSQRNARKINELASLLGEKVLAPLDRVGGLGAAPNFDAVVRWQQQNAVPKLQLYAEQPQLTLKPGYILAQ
jgi:hypothetical protein